ncbi:hypothetical protein [Massilia aquatica]|uniref:hypothetical protein n=1 Tax=Massilia aquatica TaxID=2609000 RepID=UPI001420FC0D|nr:hypothetical protein [Massilia aquatica]
MTTAHERTWLMIAIQLATLQNDIAQAARHSVGMGAMSNSRVPPAHAGIARIA